MYTRWSDTLYERLFLSWAAYWDSGHFGEIARLGYAGHPQLVLFVGWPFLIKVFTAVGIHRYWVIFMLSILLGLVVFILFYLVANKLFEKKTATRALLLFACYPGTLFLHAGYSENLFLVLSLLAFFALENQRLYLAAVLGGAASLTRLAGISIAAALVCIHAKHTTKLVAISVVLTGLLVYMLYLQNSFGNALAFFTSQAGWEKASSFSSLSFPLAPLFNTQMLTLGLKHPLLLPLAIDWIVSVIFLGMIPIVYRKLGLSYSIYTAVLMFLPLASGTYVGMNRYILPAFPVFMVLASLFKSKLMLVLVCVGLFVLQMRFITLFTNLVWVG